MGVDNKLESYKVLAYPPEPSLTCLDFLQLCEHRTRCLCCHVDHVTFERPSAYGRSYT